jgi:HSP20 family protein
MPRTVWDDLQQEWNRALTEWFPRWGGPMWGGRRALPAGQMQPFVPTTDVLKRNGDMVVRIDVPGIQRPDEELKVTLEEGDLVVKGQRRQTEEVNEGDYYRREAMFGEFERHIPVPREAQEEEIRAEYRDGVLEVILPGAAREERPRARAIPVRKAKQLQG